MDKFIQASEESPLNLSNNTKERKNRKNKTNNPDFRKKRNSMSDLIKGKKFNKVNVNSNSENNLNVFKDKNKFINPSESRDIPSNNTEIKKKDEVKQENNEVNSGDNKSNTTNSQNGKKSGGKKEKINMNNNQIEENKSENGNDDNNKSQSNNNLKNILVDNEKEKEEINSNNNNNNDNIIKTDNNNITTNKPNNDNNNNIASNSKNFINPKMNSSIDLGKHFQNDELNNNQNQINRNTTNNIFSNNLSIQNISHIKKNDQLENDDNLPMIFDKIQNNDINDNLNINNNNGEYQDIILEENGNIEQNGFEISNGRKFSDMNNNVLNNNNDNSNGRINNIFSNNNTKGILREINQGVKGENNIARSDNDKEITTESQKRKEKIREKEKSDEESNISSKEKEKDGNKKRISTEEFLENNLEEDDDFQKNESDENDDNTDFKNEETSNEIKVKNKYKKNKKNSASNPDEYFTSKESQSNETLYPKKERIFLKYIIPINYIDKIRQKKEFVINKKIPKKKRAFITKVQGNKERERLIPFISQCHFTNQYIIQKKSQNLIPIINTYFFQTKLTKYNKLRKKKNYLGKLPKVYKKAIVSPSKNSLFCIRHKNNKFESVINFDEKGNTIDINFQKAKNRNEKINIISKDKDKDTDGNISSPNDQNINKGSNIVIKQNNNVIKKISQDTSGNNIDISIQFLNKTPNHPLALRSFTNFPSSVKKKGKNFKESLYKDLRDIKNKLKNKDEYLKRNYYNLHYQKHFGDENNCFLCQEMRQKGKISEKEKGIHDALSLRNLRNLNRRPLSQLKISSQKKGKENNNIFSTNNINNIEDEFKNKYLQFNELNRTNKLNRYGSFENLTNSKFENLNRKRNFGTLKLKLNMDKEIEKNREDGDNFQYQTLKQYFNK